LNILFVCTGNTCRSAMAEGIFKEMLKDKKIENINVSSAGISAFEGQTANEKAVDILNRRGIDISNHRARKLTYDIIHSSDIILTMTAAHKKIIINCLNDKADETYPYHGHTCPVFILKEFAFLLNDEINHEKIWDVADPYGMDYNVYEKSVEEIEKQLKKIINNIYKLNNGGKDEYSNWM